jgi:hypothetical protein
LPVASDVSEEGAYDILETEYYKEFYGEGQTYFYLKRQKTNSIFNVSVGNEKVDLPSNAFRIPLPESEMAFD